MTDIKITDADRQPAARWLLNQNMDLTRDQYNALIAAFARHRRAAMIEGITLALKYSVDHLREASANAMENDYSEHAEGVGEAADLLADLTPEDILKENTNVML